MVSPEVTEYVKLISKGNAKVWSDNADFQPLLLSPTSVAASVAETLITASPVQVKVVTSYAIGWHPSSTSKIPSLSSSISHILLIPSASGSFAVDVPTIAPSVHEISLRTTVTVAVD